MLVEIRSVLSSGTHGICERGQAWAAIPTSKSRSSAASQMQWTAQLGNQRNLLGLQTAFPATRVLQVGSTWSTDRPPCREDSPARGVRATTRARKNARFPSLLGRLATLLKFQQHLPGCQRRTGQQLLASQRSLHTRTNLSPFTKGCREWDASM